MNNQLTPDQVKNISHEEMFCFDIKDNVISVYPVFEKYKCFDISYTSRKTATLAKEYVKAFFSNMKILDGKGSWEANDNMHKISEATVALVEALGSSVINCGNFAKAVLIVEQFIHVNAVDIANEQLNAIRNFTCYVPHQSDLHVVVDACKNLIDICKKFPDDAFKFFD